MIRHFPNLQRSITPAPALDRSADPMVSAKRFAKWANTLPEVQRAHAWRAGATPYAQPSPAGATVRVYLAWRSGHPWNTGDRLIQAVSYMDFRNLDGAVAVNFVHHDPPYEPSSAARHEVLAVVRTYGTPR